MQTQPDSTHQGRPGTGRPKRGSARAIRRWLLLIVPLTALILATTLVVDVKDLCAHSPHDSIDYLALSPAYDRDQMLFVVLIDQIQRSTDGGSSWKQLVNGLDHDNRLSAIAISPSFSQDGTVFLSSIGSGVFRSQDRGNSWIRVNDGLGTLDIGMMAIQPPSQDVDRSAGSRLEAPSGIVLAAGITSGLFRSENGGDSWGPVSVWPAAPGDAARVTTLAFTPLGDAAYLGDDQGRLYRSSDGGATWSKVWNTRNGGAITAIAFTPTFASDSTLFVGTQDEGILKSTDRGSSFNSMNSGLPFSLRDRLLTLRRSREGPALRRSELDVTAIALSPNYDQDATILVALWNQALFRSENGGRTWKRYQLGLSCDYQADSEAYKSPHFRQVQLSNTFATDQTAFVGGFDGLFKSTDGGRRWTQTETLPVKLMAGLATAPAAEDGSVEPASGRVSADSLPPIAITTYGGGVYTSGDGGKTWAIRNKGLSTTRLTDIVFSPGYERDSTILTASYGRLAESRSDNDGWIEITIVQKSWRTYLANRLKKIGVPDALARMLLVEAEKEKPYPTVFALSPRFLSAPPERSEGSSGKEDGDRTLYFGTRKHGIFRSLDGGRTASIVWSESSTGNSALVSSLVISPYFAPSTGQDKGDRTLFAGIYGQGVLKTVDGGETWQAVNNGLTFVERWQSEAMQTSSGYALERQHVRLAISPNYARPGDDAGDQTLFAGSGDGLFKTTNGGESWQELTIAEPDGASGPDGESGARAYIVALAISPDYVHDQTILISVRGKGLYRSEDGGMTFTRIAMELMDHNYAIRWLGFSPRFAIDDTVLAASDEELLISTDRGDTWQAVARPVRYEDSREVIHFEGDWTTVQADDASASTVTYSDAAGSRATLHFVGTGVRWIGGQASAGGSLQHGIARVYLDGSEIGTVDQYANHTSYVIEDLDFGPHTLTIEVTGTKNADSVGYRVTLDSLDVFGTTAFAPGLLSAEEHRTSAEDD